MLSDICDRYRGSLAVMCVSCKFCVNTGILFMLIIYRWQGDSILVVFAEQLGKRKLLQLFCHVYVSA
jgi:hypothetical protein